MIYNPKSKPITDDELDKFLADLDPEFDAMAVKAQAEYDRLYKVPVPRFIHLKAIAGTIMLVGALLYVVRWAIILKETFYP